MSQLDSTSASPSMGPGSMAPARGVLVKKPPTSIYTVLLILATTAMAIGCLFLALERAKYPF